VLLPQLPVGLRRFDGLPGIGGVQMFTYRIDKKNRIVYLEGEDPSLEEWKQTLLRLFADPDFGTGFHFLSDRRNIEAPRSA
jgi:hypothetical protein